MASPMNRRLACRENLGNRATASGIQASPLFGRFWLEFYCSKWLHLSDLHGHPSTRTGARLDFCGLFCHHPKAKPD